MYLINVIFIFGWLYIIMEDYVSESCGSCIWRARERLLRLQICHFKEYIISVLNIKYKKT